MARMTVAGTLELTLNGEIQQAKGEFTLNDGSPVNEPIVGSDLNVHGYAQEGQAPMIEGAITLQPGQDPAAIKAIVDGTLIVRFGTDQGFVLREAFYSGEGNFTTSRHELQFRFAGRDAEWLTSA